MNQVVPQVLARLAEDRDVKILLAVESGSRAWGFASANSDWDVRFVYVHRPDWYLSVQERRDVIEEQLPGDLDIGGWELRKALRLFAKSNPSLLEWLSSPLVYQETSVLTARLRELRDHYFSPRTLLHHYLHMAEGNYRDYLLGEMVRLKKYFYVLRPVLACRWIEAHGQMAPMEFERLVQDQLPGALMPVVQDLLERKLAGDELEQGPTIPELNQFLTSEIARIEAAAPSALAAQRPALNLLDELFRETLYDVWR